MAIGCHHAFCSVGLFWFYLLVGRATTVDLTKVKA